MRRHDERTGRTRAAGLIPLVVGWVGYACASPTRAAPPETDSASNVEAQAPVAEPPIDEPPETAGDWYARGIELGNLGDFRGAAEAFLHSYELTPTSEALFNAGLAYQTAGDAIAAIEIYRRFLAEPNHNVDLERPAEEAIAQLSRQVGSLKALRHQPDRPPVELWVDGERVELDALPLLLEPGPVVIEVVDADGVRGQETYEIAAGESLVVDVRALLPAPIDDPPDPPDIPVTIDPDPDDDRVAAALARKRHAKQLRLTTWIGLGLTGAAGISSATLGGLAAHQQNAYLDATCFEFPGGDCPAGFEPGDPQANLRAHGRYQTGAIVTGGIAGGLAVATLVVGLVSVRLDRRPPREQARVRVSPQLGGLTLEF